MGRTLDMIFAATPLVSRPAWASEGSTFSMLWEPERGDLAMRAVAQRADEYAAQLKVVVSEVARVTASQDRKQEAVYIRTEIPEVVPEVVPAPPEVVPAPPEVVPAPPEVVPAPPEVVEVTTPVADQNGAVRT